MQHLAKTLLCVGIVAAVFAATVRPAPAVEEAERRQVLGTHVDNFTLRDFHGKEVSLADYKDTKLVVLAVLGAECPVARAYASRLDALDKEFGDKVAVLGIMPNRHDSITDIATLAKEQQVEFPLLKDVGNAIADQLCAMRTPEVYLLDADRKIRYLGRVDDQFGVGYVKPTATATELRDAITALLDGRDPAVTEVESVGCHIGRMREPKLDSPVTYTNQISRLVQKHCQDCHRPGQIAPFSLTNYEETAGWGDAMLEMVRAGRMPPWLADPKVGHFANDARLSADEKQQLADWVKAGAPEGDAKDLPEPKTFVDGWRIGTPDREIAMSDKPFKVPATGEVRYQYFTVDPGFKEDTWVRAAECRPGNRSVVHHIIVFVKPPDPGSGHVVRRGEVLSDWLVATAPGAMPLVLPEGWAKLIPAHSQLVFQVHYTPSGTEQEDLSHVGLSLADPKKVRKEVGTWRAANNNFRIPAGDPNYQVVGKHTFSQDSLMLAMFPHMHLRGKAFRYDVRYPDGSEETLLDVPRYDFGWQIGYQLSEPKRLPAGTQLTCTAHFDNSKGNPANPDPTQEVRWGDQTWEEMMIGYFDMALADQDLLSKDQRSRADRLNEKIALGEVKISDDLREKAETALIDNEHFQVFGNAVLKLAPQLDRVCVNVVDGGKLRMEYCAHTPALRQYDRMRGKEFPAFGLAIVGYASGNQTVVHQDFSQLKTPDFALLGRVFSSSMHEPITLAGKPAVLSFWSRDAKAFPDDVQKLLHEVAGTVKVDTANTDTAKGDTPKADAPAATDKP